MKNFVLTGLALGLTACGAAPPAAPSNPAPKSIQGLLKVDSAEVMVAESRPPKVTVQVVGQLPDACTSVVTIQSTNAKEITLRVITLQPVGPCIQVVPPPFEQSITLRGDFTEGEYTLQVNDLRLTFRI